MGRFQRGKLAVLVANQRTHYVDRPGEISERVSLWVITSVSRDGSVIRKAREVNPPRANGAAPYLSTSESNAAHQVGAWHPVTPDLDPLDLARSLYTVTDGKPWMATVADVQAAINALRRYIVRVHQPWMPGQGPRAMYSESVFLSRADAQTELDAMAARGDTRYAHIVSPS